MRPAGSSRERAWNTRRTLPPPELPWGEWECTRPQDLQAASGRPGVGSRGSLHVPLPCIPHPVNLEPQARLSLRCWTPACPPSPSPEPSSQGQKCPRLQGPRPQEPLEAAVWQERLSCVTGSWWSRCALCQGGDPVGLVSERPPEAQSHSPPATHPLGRRRRQRSGRVREPCSMSLWVAEQVDVLPGFTWRDMEEIGRAHV